MVKINQNGFGALAVIAALACILVIGFAGWYVWNKQQDGADTNKTSQQNGNSDQDTDQSAPDPTAGWADYANPDGKFSFKHPKTWVFADRPETCAPGLVLFAAAESAVGACASEGAGQMMVTANDGDVRDGYTFAQGYIDIQESKVTADGVSGLRMTATASGQEGAGEVPDGTREVRYVFYTQGKTYVAQYTQQPAYPDVLTDFDTLVTRTLKFTKE